MVEVAHAQRVARQHRPAHAPAAGAPDLGQAAEAQAGHVAGQRRQRGERRIVVKDAVVDLVGHQQQAVARGDVHQPLQQRRRVVGAGGVVRVDHHQRAGARRHQLFDFVRVGQEAVFRRAAVIHRPALVEDGGGAPQRVVGRGQQHFVARVEQRPQRHVDQLADAVADEHTLGAGIGRAAFAVRLGHGFAGQRQALLVGVGVGFGHVRGQGLLQVVGGAETEGARVADVQADQMPALALEFTGAAGKFAADVVADLAKAVAGRHGAVGHGAAGSGRGVGPEVNGILTCFQPACFSPVVARAAGPGWPRG